MILFWLLNKFYKWTNKFSLLKTVFVLNGHYIINETQTNVFFSYNQLISNSKLLNLSKLKLNLCNLIIKTWNLILKKYPYELIKFFLLAEELLYGHWIERYIEVDCDRFEMDAHSSDSYYLQLEDCWHNLVANFHYSKVGCSILNSTVGSRMEYNQVDKLEMAPNLIFYSRIELSFSIAF